MKPRLHLLTSQRRQDGLSLIEMLVATAIGMAAIVVIMESFVSFEGRKRTTTSGNDATTAGAFALYQLTREIQSSGYGITTTPLSAPANSLGTPGFPTVLGCETNVYYNPQFANPPASGHQSLSPIKVAPVIIEDGGDGADALTVMYGSADALSTPVEFTAPIGLNYDDFQLGSNIGLNIGDAVLIAEMSPTATPARRCYMAQVTGPGSGGAGTPIDATGVVKHAIGPNGAFNAQALTTIGYQEPRLINLGQRPVAVRYSVNAASNSKPAQLVVSDQLRSPNATTVVADDVVNLQAQYGIDTNQDDAIDQWVEPTGTWKANSLTPLQISQIKAIRIGVMVRSGQLEKPDTSGQCSTSPEDLKTTPLLPATSGTAAAPASDAPKLDTVTQWRCYRYRTYQSTIPVRNMIWSGL